MLYCLRFNRASIPVIHMMGKLVFRDRNTAELWHCCSVRTVMGMRLVEPDFLSSQRVSYESWAAFP